MIKIKTSSRLMGGVKRYIHDFDKFLMGAVLILLIISLFAINSATSGKDINSRCMLIQTVGIFVGLILMIIISKLDYDLVSDLSRYIIFASFLLLLLTAFFAPEINGNRNWIMVGPVNIQPSEYTKICFAVTMSNHLSTLGENLNKPKNILSVAVHFLLYFVPIALQNDIGTALVYLGMFMVMIFVAGIKYRYLILGGISIVAVVPFIWNFMRVYQKERILYGFQPELDPLGRGYQPLASRMAIGSGQLFGLGYEKGIQSQNDLLPEIHTDFIYAIVGEEGGFLACIAVLALLVLIVVLIIRNGLKAKDQKGFFICVAVASIIIFQMLINIGMCIGVSPVIGVTLPFFSYGGSSVMSMLMTIGLVQSVCVKPERTLKFKFK